MSDSKFPTKEQYKELDELMTYILDEMWEIDDKKLIREGIIAYANKWHETQANDLKTSASGLHIACVSNKKVKIGTTVDKSNAHEYYDKSPNNSVCPECTSNDIHTVNLPRSRCVRCGHHWQTDC